MAFGALRPIQPELLAPETKRRIQIDCKRRVMRLSRDILAPLPRNFLRGPFRWKTACTLKKVSPSVRAPRPPRRSNKCHRDKPNAVCFPRSSLSINQKGPFCAPPPGGDGNHTLVRDACELWPRGVFEASGPPWSLQKGARRTAIFTLLTQRDKAWALTCSGEKAPFFFLNVRVTLCVF